MTELSEDEAERMVVEMHGPASIRDTLRHMLSTGPMASRVRLLEHDQPTASALVLEGVDAPWGRHEVDASQPTEQLRSELVSWVAQRWLTLEALRGSEPLSCCKTVLSEFSRLFAMTFDADLVIRYAEGRWPRSLGWPVHAFPGTPVTALGTPEQVADFVPTYRAAVAGEIGSVVVDNRGVSYEILAFPLADGRAMSVVRLLSMEQAVNPVDEMEELRLENQRLRAKNEELESFVQLAAHDLRAPLRHIRSFAQLLLLDDRLAVDHHAHAQRIDDAALRTAGLLDDLMRFARSGRASDLDESVDLREVVAAAAEVVGLDESQLQVHPLPTIHGSPTLLRLLFQNLLQNARRYRHADRPLRVQVTAGRGSGSWIVRIEDNGVGIAESDRERIFAPFVRALDRGEGHGVGLATCRRIVRLHSGRIEVEGDPAKGSVFVLTFPRSAPSLF